MPWRKRTTRVIDPPVEMEDAESSHGAPSGPDMHGHRSGRSDDGDPELMEAFPEEGRQQFDSGGDEGNSDEELLSQDDHVREEGSDTRTPWSVIGESVSEPRGVAALTSFDNKVLFQNAVIDNVRTCNISLPWETGVFAQIFDESDADLVPRMHAVSFPLDVASFAEASQHADGVKQAFSATLGKPIFAKAFSCLSDTSFVEERSQLFSVGVRKWVIIGRSMDACQTGRIIRDCGEGTDMESYALETIGAIMGTRSPYTVVKRANSILAFLRWGDAQLGIRDLFSEPNIWKYIQRLRTSDSGPTSAASFVSALRFAHFILGFADSVNDLVSRRIAGLSEQIFATKRKLKQAAPLSVEQVKFLHCVLKDEHQHDMDRASAAYLLIAIYGRCRHSDLCFIQDAIPDFGPEGGFLELRATAHKTGRTAQRKAQLLPILIPAVGVTGEMWLDAATSAFQRVGLLLDGEVNGPIFRPPTSDSVDALCRRGLKSGEATNLLREFLALNADGRDLNAVSSHSCKATVLSWSSKFGLDEYTRSVLGRHVSATVSSSALYARDLCIEPVRKLQELIKQIATGVFRPDAPRSEFFGAPISVVPTLVDEPCVTKDEHADELENEFIVISSDEDSTSDSSSSTCSDCSSSNPGSEAGQPIAKMPRLIPCDPKVGKWFTHKKSKISHFCRNFESLVSPVRLFVCGKRLNDNYEPVLPGKEPFADCMMCRRSAF